MAGDTDAACLSAYREHVLSRPDLVALPPTLRGKALACWRCHSTRAEESARMCHAKVMCDLADGTSGQRKDV